MNILSVVGARPNFMKVAPISRAFDAYPQINHQIVHTGQHYDYAMNELFFEQLGIPEPAVHLNVGSGRHGKQTGEIMAKFEEYALDHQFDLVLVVGDVNSTLACSLVAAKLHIPVVHVEAGLRSNDRAMPEELNRICTDQLSDYLFVSEESGMKNLKKEGFDDDRIFFVGNVMIDSIVDNMPHVDASSVLTDHSLLPETYGLVTLHRPSNVDTTEKLNRLLTLLKQVSDDHPIVFPMHPRTRNNLQKFDLWPTVKEIQNLTILEPQGYFEFLKLMKESKFVFTDSGGIQEETSYLGIPCFTIRNNTERPVTCTLGTNTMIHFDEIDTVAALIAEMKQSDSAPVIPKWDGHTADRIAKIIAEKFL